MGLDASGRAHHGNTLRRPGPGKWHFYLARKTGRPFEEIEGILNKESGLKGICGYERHAGDPGPRSGGRRTGELALEMFC